MKTYDSIDSLISAIPSLQQKEWIYANVESWKEKPDLTTFYYIPWDYIQSLSDDEIYYDKEDMEMPKEMEGKDVKGWMLVNTLGHIVANKLRLKANNDWFIDEVNHYRAYDEFRT